MSHYYWYCDMNSNTGTGTVTVQQGRYIDGVDKACCCSDMLPSILLIHDS